MQLIQFFMGGIVFCLNAGVGPVGCGGGCGGGGRSCLVADCIKANGL